MGKVFKVYLEGSKIFSCSECRTHLSTAEEVISKQYQARSGKAYLFDKVVNITLGPPIERAMTTGMHVVVDIYCNTCWNYVGWNYKEAHEEKQKFKEGKYILELARTQRHE
ncbi:TPA: hypothetical protein N0F65_000734 [Lagenidium giganteum]|uniref:Protein yippee-like n=1 Tax=Lagenidium giganteum TaxID=4803 RepID=A0AAV2ZG53_9STRA|nr:TPA: hypothetical protein N0F65_000734 [Lagenidium giganteum]